MTLDEFRALQIGDTIYSGRDMECIDYNVSKYIVLDRALYNRNGRKILTSLDSKVIEKHLYRHSLYIRAKTGNPLLIGNWVQVRFHDYYFKNPLEAFIYGMGWEASDD